MTKKKRKDWAETMLRGTQTGKDFIFDDEVSFGLTGPPMFYRKVVHGKDGKNMRKNVDRKGTVGFWGMIGFGFKRNLIRVRETLNAERYAKILTTEWNRTNLAHKKPQLSLVTDNAPWHVGHGGFLLTQSTGIQMDRLPPTSPDLNPIETFWAMMARRLYQGGKTYSTDSKLETAVQKVWSDLPQEKIDSLVLSIRDRAMVVVLADGDEVKWNKTNQDL
ncbi:hypothetical protein BLNAU_15171 [Blattamonas nauphoetae]|uniref:Tc1-like transposase DDE domain-containing protein n=1 Tax=Blattamonas nauphoetae TaxID=2049346 RepID=A0ABQ9XBG6_9EUKA|nr:hypothetical protein BLNAU_15171 [Blattamonas nauphoetae]